LTKDDIAKVGALFGLGAALMGGYVAREFWKVKANARRRKQPWE
jgi:hypothetical protein